MNTKYGLGVLGWLLVLAILVLVLAEDLYTWVQQGTLPGVEFLVFGIAAVVLVVVGLRSMQTHRPPPGQ